MLGQSLKVKMGVIFIPLDLQPRKSPLTFLLLAFQCSFKAILYFTSFETHLKVNDIKVSHLM